MSTVQDFLSSVLPSQGWRFVQLLFPPDAAGQRKSPQKDFYVDDMDDLVGFADWGVKKGADAYIAIGGFMPGADGVLRRTAQLSAFHRCLRVDLDVGAQKAATGQGYATKIDAAKALGAFNLAHSLPAPWIIDSGYGLHVYWVFDRDLTLREWLPMAEQLRTAAKLQGLIVDPTTTIDAARVLRLPGTTNFKNGAQAPVRILAAGSAIAPEDFTRRLPNSTMVATPIPGAPAPVALHGAVSSLFAPELPDDLSAGRFPPYFLKNVISQCPGMMAMFQNRGAGVPEPLWKLALDLVNKSDDAPDAKERVARRISEGHSSFTEGGFQTKWAQVKGQDYHPPTCDRMGKMGMPECVRCPLRATIKSPVSLGRPQPLQAAAPDLQPAIPLPAPMEIHAFTPGAVQQLGIFLITGGSSVPVVDGNLTKDIGIRNGLPCMRVELKEKAADGSEVRREWWAPIIHYRILEVERLLDAVGKHSLIVITFDRNSDKFAKVEFTQKAMSEPQTFVSTLYAHGIHVSRKQAASLQDVFMPEFASQLQRARAANQIAGRCGWTDDRTGFVLGTRLFTADKIEHVRPANAPEEMEAYHAAGEETAWRKAFDICLSGGPDRQAVMALAIAAPLMVFTGLDGVMLNAYSPESGIGKSTICDAALSIWGAPEKLRKDFRDTANATFKLASIVGNLPMVVDEFTNVEGKALSDYIYTITQGREKHRLTADSRINQSGARWCLPTIVTSNNSVHEKLQAFRGDAVAEAARVFELRLRPLNVDMTQLGQIKSDLLGLRGNYGFLGPRIVALLLSKDVSYWKDLVTSRIAWWDKEVSLDASDRFRAATCALCDIGAALGKAMGYNFDRQAVVDTMRMQWTGQQQEFELNRKSPFDYVNNFIVENLRNFAVLGGPDQSSMVSTAPHNFLGELRGKTISGKHVTQNVIIPLEGLRQYVREKNGNFKTVSEWMQAELNSGGLVSRYGKLMFLEGQFHQVTTPAVEFKAQILGGAALKLAAVEGDVPALLKENTP